MTPQEAYIKALGEGPSDLTRNAVLSDSTYSYLYSVYVDKRPSDGTRQAVLDDDYYVYMYSLYVDRCWRVDTWQSSTFRRTGKMPFEYSLKWLTFEDVPDTVALV